MKNQILASQIALKRSQNNEAELESALAKFFKIIETAIQRNLETYWNDNLLLQGHIDLILQPLTTGEDAYYQILEQYIKREYSHPNTIFIAYGSDTAPSMLADEDEKFTGWLKDKNLKIGEYYLVVGRFVPENNYETMIREFMRSHSTKDFAIITNLNKKLELHLEKTLHFGKDSRIKFVGTVYDHDLLKKIRENAYGYFHGHEVGGTNPSLLEALGSTELNLLLDVGFNREVASESALYWTKKEGNLAVLIEKADCMDSKLRAEFGHKAKERIKNAYSWKFIGDEYKRLWQR